MSGSIPAWQAPEPGAGPAPGIAFASPGSRLVAYILDLVIQFLAILMVGVVGFILGAVFVLFGVLAGFAILALTIGYFPYFWAKDGQTPGMNAMKIKVVRDADGGQVTIGQAILRLIGLWIGIAVFWIGVLWIFVDKRQRGWQDLVGGTVVVNAQPADYVA